MGTLKVNGAISATGTISASSFLGNIDWSYIVNEPNFTLKRNNQSFYVGLGNHYPAGTTPAYYRITLSDSQLNMYGMYTLDLLVHQKYDSGYGGKIIINAYHNASDMRWYGFSASVSGTLTSDIKVYGSNGKYFYISGCAAWGNLAIENMIVADSAIYSDLSGTSVDIVTSLPSGYQTATMTYELNSSNYSSYTMPASYWNWSGQSGQPTWLWGGNEFGKWYVYNPANFNVNYASGSNYTYRLQARGITDNITTAPDTGSLVYDYNVLPGNAAGLFPTNNNANAIITLNKHSGGYDSQLGFSSNGRIYYRSFNGGALNTSSGWNTIAFTSDTVSNSDTVDGYHASSFLRKQGWWNSNSSYSADTTEDGIVFAYSNHGVPNHWGTLVTFGYGNGRDYNLQLHGAGNNELYFRNRSADYGQKPWQTIIHSGNYTSYCAPASHSHSYASLASPNNMIHSGNEFTFVPENYSGAVWFNYRAGWSTSGNIGLYIFGNGRGSIAPIEHLYDITHNYGSGNPGSSTPGYGTVGAIYYKV